MSLATDQFKGYDQFGNPVAQSMMLGYHDHELLDASSGDATASTVLNCRAIKADGAGIVKIDYKDMGGNVVTEVLQLNAGVPMPVRNVSKLYQYYFGITDGTAVCYTSAGASVTNAIKLLR